MEFLLEGDDECFVWVLVGFVAVRELNDRVGRTWDEDFTECFTKVGSGK